MAEDNGNGTLGYELLTEFVGTFILILFGNGAVAVSVATGSYDLWAVSLMWFIGVALAIYAAGAVSGAHINPAVTISIAAFTDFPWRKVGPYVIAQILGAFVASVGIYIAFGGVITALEASENMTRGEPGSQLSAMIFTTYAPNPAIIGILVAGLVAYEAPVSMAALNPARDLGPRIFTLLAGWGEIAIPGPRGGFWIPTVSTIVGGLVGGAIYHLVYKRAYPVPAEVGEEPPEVR